MNAMTGNGNYVTRLKLVLEKFAKWHAYLSELIFDGFKPFGTTV